MSPLERSREAGSHGRPWFNFAALAIFMIGIMSLTRYIGGRDGALMELSVWILVAVSLCLTWREQLRGTLTRKRNSLVFAGLSFCGITAGWLVLRLVLPANLEPGILKSMNQLMICLLALGLLVFRVTGRRKDSRGLVRSSSRTK